MKEKEFLNYRYMIGYGVGQYYNRMKDYIPSYVHFDYLCDVRWKQIGKECDGIPVISPESLRMLEKPFVIVFAETEKNFCSIGVLLKEMGIPYIHADEAFHFVRTITGRELKRLEEGVYLDNRRNRIEFCKDIEDSLTIQLRGHDNFVKIEEGISIKTTMQICCGNHTFVFIGKRAAIVEVNIFATEGSVRIGDDCLFSYQIVLRNHDSHHLFDKASGKRINYAGNIEIGNHVWVGYGATLLGSATIGDNSVVGSGAITSSRFPKEVLIAGNPAKIIREGIVWSKDNTDFYNRDLFEDCLEKKAKEYV